MHRHPSPKYSNTINTRVRVKIARANVEDDLELILSLDDTDVQIDDKTSATIQQSTSAFTTDEFDCCSGGNFFVQHVEI